MTNILLIGCGNMGSALCTRWAKLGYHITVIEPRELSLAHVTHVQSLNALPSSYHADMIVLAVKPQQLAGVVSELKNRFSNKTIFLSIAAGKTITYFENHLGADACIIRAMPNTPALIGKGMTALFANKHVGESAHNFATTLMQTVGEVVWLDNESQIDVVTAISGSGPAYFFTFMACLVEAAVKQGLSPAIAEKLVMQTAVGASRLAAESNIGLCDLITNVTSKGGTTEAALEVFNHEGAIGNVVQRAVDAAVERAKILRN